MDFSLLRDFMDRLTDWIIPGNCVRVCVDNKEVFSYQSGYEDYENKVKMSGEKLMNIYSCSKPITAVAALQLFEKGYFLLDTPLYDFIPEYRHMTVKDKDGNIREAKGDITMRHLFTMTAGLNYNLRTPEIEEARALTDGKMNTLTVAKCIAKAPLSFDPGDRWQYSLCHDVLAAAVEAISGKKFRDYVKENIFSPLEMNDSYYHNEQVIDRVAELYRYVDSAETNLVKLQSSSGEASRGEIQNVGKGAVYVLGPEYDSGGAGVTTSISDYSKFASALANGGVGQNGEQIISASMIELMRTNQLNEYQRSGMTWSQLKGYGYGLGVRTLIDKAQAGSCGNLGEFGWGGAAGATLLVDPDLHLSVAYAHHMLNPQEGYYQPRLRNIVYSCLGRR